MCFLQLNRDHNKDNKDGPDSTRMTQSRVYRNSHQSGLSIVVVLFVMVFACEACGSSFNSDRGRLRHQLQCEDFLLADNEASTVDDALEKYRCKLQRKKHKAALSEVSESLTGGVVRDLFFLISILIIHHSF